MYICIHMYVYMYSYTHTYTVLFSTPAANGISPPMGTIINNHTFLMQAVQTPPKLQKTIFDLRAIYGHFAGTPFIQPHLATSKIM